MIADRNLAEFLIILHVLDVSFSQWMNVAHVRHKGVLPFDDSI